MAPCPCGGPHRYKTPHMHCAHDRHGLTDMQKKEEKRKKVRHITFQARCTDIYIFSNYKLTLCKQPSPPPPPPSPTTQSHHPCHHPPSLYSHYTHTTWRCGCGFPLRHTIAHVLSSCLYDCSNASVFFPPLFLFDQVDVVCSEL